MSQKFTQAFKIQAVEKALSRTEGIKPNQVTLHSDNGGPMRGATMLATLQQLGAVLCKLV